MYKPISCIMHTLFICEFRHFSAAFHIRKKMPDPHFPAQEEGFGFDF